jgi:hypothetical protein
MENRFHCSIVSLFGSLTISARSGYFSFRKVSKSLRQLKTAVTKVSIYSNFAEIVKEPIVFYRSTVSNETIEHCNLNTLQIIAFVIVKSLK